MKLEIADLGSIEEQIAELVRKKQEVLANNRTTYLDCVREAVKTFSFTTEDVGIVAASEEAGLTRRKRGTGKKQITAKDRENRKLVTVCVPNTDETLQLYLNTDGSFTRVKRGKSPTVFEIKIKDGTIGEWIVATEKGKSSTSEDANLEPLATTEPVTPVTEVKKVKKSSKKQ